MDRPVVIHKFVVGVEPGPRIACPCPMTSPLNDALAADGILSRRLHPALIGRIDAAVKRGELVPLFPGTYAPARSFHSLVAALADWDPNAVLMAASAARLSWWPNLDDDLVRAATTRRPVRRVPGTKLSLIPIPAELVAERGGLRIQHPAASTLDLAREIGPAAIDEALRRRAVSLGELRDAFELMTWRTGNPQLAAWLRASRDGAWSHLERDAHALLHAARITGWKANYEVRARGRLHFIDVAFPGRSWPSSSTGGSTTATGAASSTTGSATTGCGSPAGLRCTSRRSRCRRWFRR